MDRAIVNSLLVKLGTEDPSRFDDGRATKKLKTRLFDKGVPTDMTPDETKLVTGLGFTVGGAVPTTAKASKPEKGDKPKPAAAKAKSTGDKSKVEAKPAKEKPAAGKSNKTGAGLVFREAFKKMNVKVDKEELKAKLKATGASDGTVSGYISWAKRLDHRRLPDSNQWRGNPWGFIIEEVKDPKTGVKYLKKVSDEVPEVTGAIKPKKSKKSKKEKKELATA